MPWTCGKCETDEIPDHASTCPRCGDRKLAWTVNEGQTRRFQVALTGRDKVELLTGDGQAAAEVTALPRAGAEGRAKEGRAPDPEHVLVVRLTARPGADLSVRVTVLFGGREPREVVVPGPASVEGPGPVEVRLAFTCGEGAPVRFPGLHVIDVTEDDGHAPSVGVAALKKKAQELPVRAFAGRPTSGNLWGKVVLEKRFFSHGFADQPDPIHGTFAAQHLDVKVLSAPPGARLTPRLTDARGAFDFGEVPAGAYELELTADGLRSVHRVEVPLPPDTGDDGVILRVGPPRPTPRDTNLKVGQELAAQIAKDLQSFNQWTPESVLQWINPVGLIDIIALNVQVWTMGEDVDEEDRPPHVVQLPAPNYGQFRKWMRIARGKGIGNCSEKAAWAAVAAAGRGLHPVEFFALQKADHAFCAVGRDPESRLDDMRTWGRDAVIIDPWLEEAYPASEIGWRMQHFKAVHEGLPVPPTKFGGMIRH